MKIWQFSVGAGVILLGLGYGIFAGLSDARKSPVTPASVTTGRDATTDGEISKPSSPAKSGKKEDALELAEDIVQASHPNNQSEVQQLFAVLAKVTRENAQPVAEEIRSQGGPNVLYAFSADLGAWASLDPSSAIAYVGKVTPFQFQKNGTMAIFSAWAKNDYPGAFRAANALPDDRLKEIALQSVNRMLSTTDPEAALDAALAVPGTAKDYDLSQIFWRLSRRDPALTAQRAAELATGEARDMAIDLAASSFGEKDPTAAMKWAQSLHAPGERQRAVGIVAGKWVGKDIDSVTAWLKSQPPGSDRDNLVESITRALSNNPEEAVPLLDLVISPNAQNEVLTGLAFSYTKKSASAAEAWAEQQTDPVIKKKIYEGMVGALKERDPESAANLALRVFDGDSQKSTVEDVVGSWAGESPADAAAWLSKLPDVRKFSGAFALIAANWGDSDPEAAARWAESLPPGEDGDYARMAVGSHWSQADPKAAIAWASKLSGKNLAETMLQIGDNWAAKNPEEAAQSAGQIPSGEPHECFAVAVMRKWLAQDQDTALKWFDASEPTGAERDDMIGEITPILLRNDPSLAIKWTLSVADANTRASQLQEVAQQWFDDDPAAARTWITSSPDLPDSVKKDILGDPSGN